MYSSLKSNIPTHWYVNYKIRPPWRAKRYAKSVALLLQNTTRRLPSYRRLHNSKTHHFVHASRVFIPIYIPARPSDRDTTTLMTVKTPRMTGRTGNSGTQCNRISSNTLLFVPLLLLFIFYRFDRDVIFKTLSKKRPPNLTGKKTFKINFVIISNPPCSFRSARSLCLREQKHEII